MEVTAWLLYTLLSLLMIGLYCIQRNQTYWKRRGIPHKKPKFLLGNMTGFRKTRLLEDIAGEIYNKFKGSGPFCGFYFFQRPSVLVLDKALAKNILIKDFGNFANRGLFYNDRFDPLRSHLFALDGAKWKHLRQKLSPTFTSGKMKFMFSTVVRVAEQFVEVFDEMVLKSPNVEIKELMARFTTDVIGTCAFGIECNSLKDPNAEFRIMGRMAFQKARYGGVLMRFLQSYPNLARRLRMRQTHDDVQNFFLRIVRETVSYREQNSIKRNDFMDLLMELKNQKSADGLGGLTVEEIAAQAFVFFLAGFETSSTTLGFALYELARHPEWQNKLRTEITEVLAKHKQEFSYDCMKQLYLMEQVISEILRLYTILPFLQRKAINDYPVPGHPRYIIENGVSVIIPSAAYHHDPEFYPDPYAFKPERFSPELLQQRDSVEWLAFGDGPRNCIGMRFGQMQVRIGLAYLLKNFKFSVSKETQVPLKFDVLSFLLSAKGGIVLRVEKI